MAAVERGWLENFRKRCFATPGPRGSVSILRPPRKKAQFLEITGPQGASWPSTTVLSTPLRWSFCCA